jgi:hypothetical protein
MYANIFRDEKFTFGKKEKSEKKKVKKRSALTRLSSY